ncbi:MAG: hypothetical protein ACMVY4_12240 [Minwuia sp.]|uniref:hypothetical protein n=1 Tax=Minwuia sp. TaxID=2493630 RepID=UPI003A8B2CA8
MHRLLVLAFWVMFLSTSKYSYSNEAEKFPGFYDREAVISAKGASVLVFDHVSGGCWTNIDAVKNTAILSLRNIFKISAVGRPQEFPAIQVWITAVGLPLTQGGREVGCAGSLSIEFVQARKIFPNTNRETIIFSIVSDNQLRIFVGSGNLNDEFRQAVGESMDQFAIETLKVRGQ